MLSPQGDSYSCASGGRIAAGRFADQLGAVSIASTDATAPVNTPGQILALSLHGSSGSNSTTGTQYRAAVSGNLAYPGNTVYSFGMSKGAQANVTLLYPVMRYYNETLGNYHEDFWTGFRNMPTGDVRLISEHRLNALVNWAKATQTNIDWSRFVLTGGSMGGWGTLTYGIRRAHLFPAIYPDRPRWSNNGGVGWVDVADFNAGYSGWPVSTPLLLTPEDGGTSYADHLNIIAYVSNTANKVPWVGWCIGRQDGFASFDDSIAAVNAMRAAKRGFAFEWNNGNHGSGPWLDNILASYPFGTFQLGKGYPLFTNHSGDQDPNVDLVGGINLGLSFRNVVESASSWSCEVTSILGARTVTVEPISDVFRAAVTPQNITIPGANYWVPVTFTA